MLAQLVGEPVAAQVQRRVLDRLQHGRRGRPWIVGRAPQALLQNLLDADALVAQLDQRPLVGAQRHVPRLLDGPLTEPPLTHDRPRGTVRQQVAQHPQHIGAPLQLRLAGDVQQCPVHAALLQLEVQRREPIVHVARQRR